MIAQASKERVLRSAVCSVPYARLRQNFEPVVRHQARVWNYSQHGNAGGSFNRLHVAYGPVHGLNDKHTDQAKEQPGKNAQAEIERHIGPGRSCGSSGGINNVKSIRM